MATFALIHGGFHTSDCWNLFKAELERRGHGVITVDLPVSDPSAGPDRYLEAAAAGFEGAAEPVVVIGHSVAGWTTLQLERRIPVAGIVFLCSIIFLTPGVYPDEPVPMIAADPEDWTPNEDGVITMAPDAGREAFYHDVPADIAAEAISHLVPQAMAGVGGPPGKLPSTVSPSVYVQAADDRALSKAWSDWVSVVLTGRAPVVIPGSHSPFLSRPSELADLVESVVEEFTPVVA